MAEGGEEPARGGEPDGGTLSAASIRKKAIEVGSRVDALQTAMMQPAPRNEKKSASEPKKKAPCTLPARVHSGTVPCKIAKSWKK